MPSDGRAGANHSELCAAALRHLSEGDPAQAEDAYRRVLAEDPDHEDASRMLAVCLAQRGELAEAIPWVRHALDLNPNSAAAASSLAIILQAAGRVVEALESFERAIQLAPSQAVLHFRRAQLLVRAGRPREALAGFAHALQLDPGNASARWNEAFCLMRLGHFAQAWPKLEACFRLPELGLARNYAEHLWLGTESVAGKTVFLYGSSALSDPIHFCRYVPLLAERGARVIIEAPVSLQPLLQTLEGVAELIEPEQPLPHFDLHVPLPGLPLAFRSTLDSIPAAPYLRADPSRVQAWAGRLERGRGRRVGLAGGAGAAPAAETGGFPLECVEALAGMQLELISLQTDLSEDRQPVFERFGIPDASIDPLDLSDTAALMMNLDLVIGIDGPAVHLAAALGRPTWILLPFVADWRWMTERSDSPWYPSVRLFRQASLGDWGAVAQAVRTALA